MVRRGVGPDGTDRLSINAPATNESTRDIIIEVKSLIDQDRVSPDDVMQLEIALAEVFNNIVEHAYADRDDGRIEITIEMLPPGMHFTIVDTGAEMPQGRLPVGHSANPDLSAHEQAEGGYGLHLIRLIAKKLRYNRVGDENQLTFRIALRAA